MSPQILRLFSSNQLSSSLTNRQSIRLREEIGHQLIMIIHWLVCNYKGLLRFSEPNKFNRNNSSLMQQLEETVLSIGSRLSKVDNSSRILNDLSFFVNSLAITLHIQLLNVRSKLTKSLAIRNDSTSRKSLNRSSEKSKKTQHHRNIFLNYPKFTVMSFSFKNNPSIE